MAYMMTIPDEILNFPKKPMVAEEVVPLMNESAPTIARLIRANPKQSPVIHQDLVYMNRYNVKTSTCQELINLVDNPFIDRINECLRKTRYQVINIEWFFDSAIVHFVKN